MEEALFEVVLSSANHIPSGRHLPRTPPMTSVKKHLDFEDMEPVMPNSNAEADGDIEVLGCSSLKMENPYTMLKGMKGYHLTPDDLNFIKKKAEDEYVKKLQEELAEIQALLKIDVKLLELALVSRATAQVTLSLIPSSDVLANWAKLVLRETSPSDFTHLDTKSLLAVVKMEEIQRLTDQKKKVIAMMEATAAETCKKKAEERGHLEMQVANEELKIQELMRELTGLKSDLLQQETNKGENLKEDPEKRQAANGERRYQQQQRKAVKSSVNEIACKSRPKSTNNKKSVKLVQSVSKQKSEVGKGDRVKLVKVRGRREQTAPLQSLQPVAGLRRSKRIANRS
ncbi:uncharacterized protein LOC103131965 isoform X1 [Poecilia formosa]|uniref:uncharacterized protein LOC103131965 isoform X1 n=1 Tax=Poecilia formosa TaxID=48698 RepID=UPI00044429CA|nr:PREDICTED: uncharacterized protein LOC103131965 isoform X1 [Poecilia formosa]XP_016522529.1 PREDICTED: uncharacterized protein LOC103131965 isoform X1 [Poecilia formosa]